jgi:ribosomal protein L11 methyltransferase
MPYYEFTIAVADRFKDQVIKKLAGSGCLGVIEQDEAVIAYFPEAVDVKTITNDLSLMRALIEKSGEANGLTFSHRLIPEQDWNESWKKGFVPIDVGERFTILPPWEKQRAGRINLVRNGLRNRPS